MILSKEEFKYLIEYQKDTSILFVTGDIDEDMSTKFCKEIIKIENDSKNLKEFTLLIRLHTRGGDVTSSLKMYDCLKNIKINTEIIIDGLVASGGTIFMCGADKVKINKNAYVMIHELFSGYFDRYSHLKNRSNYLDKLMNNILDIYNEKIKDSNKFITKEFLEKDVWLNAEEAHKLGLVDEII
jgi:ATP-dependent Clp endopeptidase proteolytic subunit ClpP